MFVISHWSNFMKTALRFRGFQISELCQCWCLLIVFLLQIRFPGSWYDQWCSVISWTFGQLCYKLWILYLFQKMKGEEVLLFSNGGRSPLSAVSLLWLPGEDWSITIRWWWDFTDITLVSTPPQPQHHCSPCGFHWHHHWKKNLTNSGWWWKL